MYNKIEQAKDMLNSISGLAQEGKLEEVKKTFVCLYITLTELYEGITKE